MIIIRNIFAGVSYIRASERIGNDRDKTTYYILTRRKVYRRRVVGIWLLTHAEPVNATNKVYLVL